jgi:hypothetical protein
MDQGNLAILVDAKFEYTKQLINILKNNLFQGIKKIYNDAKEYSIEHDELDKVLKKFQFYLSEIPKWNQEVILNEVTEILDKSKCDWLEELITAVFVSHTRILTSINSNKSKKKINLNIPKIDHFIHQCYIDVARAFWKTPYLFDDSLNNYEYQRNRRDAEGIIETCIQETIRKQLPVKHILKEYLGKDYETDDEEEPKDIESEDYSNLRKMVKAEIENCSKEQLIGKVEEEVSPEAEIVTSQELEAGAVAEASVNVSPEVEATPVESLSVNVTPEVSATPEENSSENVTPVEEVKTELSTNVSVTPDAPAEAVPAEAVPAEATPAEAAPEVKLENDESNQITMEIKEPEQTTTNNDMKIETLDLDSVDSLEDLTKLDITEVNVSNPDSSVIDLNTVEGLEDLDSELSQVNLSDTTNDNNVSSITDILNETPTLEKDVSNIKKIVIQPSVLNDEDRRKKDVLKKYGRKRNFQFFNDSVESDDEF